MSHIVTRKGPIGEESKRHADSPVKEMKKKMAANAEKEKQTANAEKDKQTADKEKTAEKSILNEKQADKSSQNDKGDKVDKKDKAVDKKEKSIEKVVEKSDKKDKSTEKIVDKTDKKEKSTDKVEKAVEKKSDKAEKKEKIVEKVPDKKEKPADKKEAPVAQVEKAKDDAKENGKAESSEKSKKDTPKAKQNGARVNGEPVECTVSSEEEDDQMFPELAYEDSDVECFEPPTPEGPSRSYTRRSQVKSSRTPETPRPTSDKQADKDYVPDDPKESKLLKLKDDIPSDRKLRSSDSPRRQDKNESPKPQEKADGDKEKRSDVTEKIETKDKPEESKTDDKPEIEVTMELDNEEGGRKPDTNYSKSRVKVSPYRRSMRLADQTQTSIMANYTGNNTTMEMDITETSVAEEPPNAESPYLSGLRSIRGRRSYKPLKEMTLRNIGVNTSIRSSTSVSESSVRPTGTVVGRKRKPEADAIGDDVHPDARDETRSKRAKLLERLGGLTRPFRFTSAASDRLCVESTAEIVGINTDLPLTAPVAAADTFDPESIKHSTPLPARPQASAPAAASHRDKRCSIM